MKLAIQQAAKMAGVDRTTIYRDAKKGKISLENSSKGKRVVDVAELERAYGPLQQDATLQNVAEPQTETSSDNKMLQREIEIRDEKIATLEAQMTRERQQAQESIEDLRSDRNHWRDQAKNATALLTHEREQEQPANSPQINGDGWRQRVGRWIAGTG